ncbi:PREDICTED: uncharacterized protein LOC109482084 [Branchiostoma belcheri]|uniref:Uncharacterized protein LOC109482084 n=1 Tax=Branchiostoma belcheri TaxID=7741 RepID=A0A6P5A1S1_BRABE|nr:PREDICTED: uncharacterized protein LOC109482084 [Branchiostoma belcheri]
MTTSKRSKTRLKMKQFILTTFFFLAICRTDTDTVVTELTCPTNGVTNRANNSFEGTNYLCMSSSNGYNSEYCQSASGGSTLCYQCCTSSQCNTQQLTGGAPTTRQSIAVMVATCMVALLATVL